MGSPFAIVLVYSVLFGGGAGITGGTLYYLHKHVGIDIVSRSGRDKHLSPTLRLAAKLIGVLCLVLFFPLALLTALGLVMLVVTLFQ